MMTSGRCVATKRSTAAASPMSRSPCATAMSSASCGAAFDDGPADLAARAGDQHLHGNVSAALERRRLRHLSWRAAASTPAGSGHSMPMLRIVPQQRALVRRRVVVSALVLEIGRLADSTRNPCANPGGTHSMWLLASDSSAPTQRPKVGELRRRSTATSKTAPLTTRTSFPCGLLHLVMQPAQGVACRAAVVVLHEIQVEPGVGETLRGSTTPGRSRGDRRTPSDAAAPRPGLPGARISKLSAFRTAATADTGRTRSA